MTALDDFPCTPLSSSPLTLTTPQRGRPMNRYPDSLGRVPLHRRGTSNTYERLEDLLREAGYKETRVFTPERDRIAARSPTEKQDCGNGNTGMRGSVGAVVDFITGLVSRGSSMAPATPVVHLENGGPPSDVRACTPPSPLARTLRVKDSQAKRVASRASLSRHASSENMRRRTSHIDLSLGESSHRHHMHEVVQLHRSSHGLPHHPHSNLRDHNIHHHSLNNHSSKSAFTKPDQPNARAYLRHMASAPNIQPLVKRPSLSEASLRSHAIRRDYRKGSRRTFILNDDESVAESDHGLLPTDENEHVVHPPLPRNWIESVAKALLSGVGGPTAIVSDTASTKTVSTRNSCALSDKSNRNERGRTKPPFLCAQVQDAKARTSEGQVSCTRVMCRSTPTSRGNSRVRGSAQDDRKTTRSDGKRREGDKPRNRGRGKDRDAGVVPTLARTQAENDDWIAPSQRYTSGWGLEGSAQAYRRGMWSDNSDDDDDDDDEDEEEDEGELGLDRLLVPARRQHSIQSLRKHLQRHPSRIFSGHTTSPRSGRASPFGGAPAGRLEWGDASWGASRGQNWLASQEEEGEEGPSYVFSSEMGTSKSSTRWRGALPGLAQWTTSTR